MRGNGLKSHIMGIRLFTLDIRNVQFPEKVGRSLARSPQERVHGPKSVGVQDICAQYSLIYVFSSRVFVWNQDLDLIFLCPFQVRIISDSVILMRVHTLQELVLSNFFLLFLFFLCSWMLLMWERLHRFSDFFSEGNLTVNVPAS